MEVEPKHQLKLQKKDNTNIKKQNNENSTESETKGKHPNMSDVTQVESEKLKGEESSETIKNKTISTMSVASILLKYKTRKDFEAKLDNKLVNIQRLI